MINFKNSNLSNIRISNEPIIIYPISWITDDNLGTLSEYSLSTFDIPIIASVLSNGNISISYNLTSGSLPISLSYDRFNSAIVGTLLNTLTSSMSGGSNLIPDSTYYITLSAISSQMQSISGTFNLTISYFDIRPVWETSGTLSSFLMNHIYSLGNNITSTLVATSPIHSSISY